MKQDGFTLIELMIVVSVLGIIMAVVIVGINPSTYLLQGRDGRRMTDLAAVQSAIEQYFAQTSSYPPLPPAVGSIPDAGNAWTVGGVTYLKSVPADPSGGSYEYCLSGTNYMICANMETTPLPSSCLSPAYGCTRNCCLTNPF